MTDPISDYLTRLRNAIKAHHRIVEIPASNLKKEITRVLYEKGYILKYKFEFISDPTFTSGFKCERVQEIIDFLLLEENYTQCAELLKIKNAVEIQYLLEI